MLCVSKNTPIAPASAAHKPRKLTTHPQSAGRKARSEAGTGRGPSPGFPPPREPAGPNGHGSKSHTPSEHPNPHYNRLKWVVHLPRNGTIGFDPQPNANSPPFGSQKRDEDRKMPRDACRYLAWGWLEGKPKGKPPVPGPTSGLSATKAVRHFSP